MLAERLRYSIHNCPSIDMDNYMLSRNTDAAEGSDTEYWGESSYTWLITWKHKWYHCIVFLIIIIYFFSMVQYSSVWKEMSGVGDSALKSALLQNEICSFIQYWLLSLPE